MARKKEVKGVKNGVRRKGTTTTDTREEYGQYYKIEGSEKKRRKVGEEQ